MSLSTRERVLLRARGTCEACLARPASYVVPESHGSAAWRLRAVCLGCRFRKMAREGIDLLACDPTPAMDYEDVRRRWS